MKNKKLIILLIVLLTVGFATVSTTLILNGVINISFNNNDFNVVFINAKLDNTKRNDFISEDKKHIEFTSNVLKSVNDKTILQYEVANTSRNYDANVSVTCSSSTSEYVMFNYTPTSMVVLAGETKTGKLTASMLKVVEEDIDIPVTCTLVAEPIERDILEDEFEIPFSKSGVMTLSSLHSKIPKYSNVTKIEFENKLKPHETIEEYIYDLSSKRDNSVMGYLVPNGETLTTNKDYLNKELEDTTAYTLYIQGDTGVIANSYSSFLFSYFNNLLEIVNLQYLDTSNVTNMSSMFHDCSNLTKLDLSNFDTSKVTDMSWMFMDCNSLTTLDVSNFDTSKVTDMNKMFNGCENLTSVDVSNFDTSKVTDMSGMFMDCNSLTTLDVSNFDTSKVTDMSWMFDRGKNLTSLDISNFDTKNVTNMSYMFSGCQNLSSLDISNFDTKNVTNMARMFSNCSSLKNLDISNFDTINVTDMSSMFYGCNNLTNLDVNNFDTRNVTDMSGMFSGCSNLTNLDLSNFNTSNLINIGNEIYYFYGMFYNCTKLKELNISNFDFSKVEVTFNAFKSMPSDATIIVHDEDAQNFVLGLTSTDRPSSWTTSNVIITT